MIDKIYAIYKKKPYTRGTWYQADDREFTSHKECLKEANKIGGISLIKRVKTESGDWEDIKN